MYVEPSTNDKNSNNLDLQLSNKVIGDFVTQNPKYETVND